jgi:glutathione synthase/RimK-type ligase-like ATP-grasp enzyme
MSNIAIFCRSFEMGVEPFTSDYYWQGYQDLLFALKERGAKAYFTTDNNSYKDYGLFETAYTTDVKTDVNGLKPVKNVVMDLVFDRGSFIGRNVASLNPAILLKIGMDKTLMYKHFADYQPFSVICHSKDEVLAAFDKIEGEKIVVKDPTSFGGGYGVYIGSREKVLQQIPDTYPLLVQEFFDTSAGVPGQVAGVHDMRLSVCGGKIIGSYIRKAQEGSLHSNVSKGGTMHFFDVSQVPAELVELVQDIDLLFARWPRYYSIDFMYTAKGWKMVEINPYLALLPRTDGEEAEKTLERLADYLVSVAETARKRREAVASTVSNTAPAAA